MRVTGDAHITRVWRMGCPKRRDTHITVTPVLSVHIACVAGAKRGGSGGGGRRKASLPIPLPLSTPASQSGLHVQWKLADEGLRDWQNLFAITRFLFIEVLFRTFLYYYRGNENCSLYRGLGYIEVRYSIEVPLYRSVWQGPTVGVRFIDVSVRELIIS